MKSTTSYYNIEIQLNKHRGLQPSEIHNMPYYVFNLYTESLSEELKAQKRQNDEYNNKQNSKVGRSYKQPKFR